MTQQDKPELSITHPVTIVPSFLPSLSPPPLHSHRDKNKRIEVFFSFHVSFPSHPSSLSYLFPPRFLLDLCWARAKPGRAVFRSSGAPQAAGAEAQAQDKTAPALEEKEKRKRTESREEENEEGVVVDEAGKGQKGSEGTLFHKTATKKGFTPPQTSQQREHNT